MAAAYRRDREKVVVKTVYKRPPVKADPDPEPKNLWAKFIMDDKDPF